MIKVLNRELLIPNNERYLGTEYDTYSAVRLFQLDRVCSDGVDIADLLFKLDLLYPEDRTIYALTSSTTISGGTVYVNKISFLKKQKTAGTYTFTYNGSAWTLSGSSVNISEYGIRIIDGTPSSGNTITVVLATSSERYDVVDLSKEVTDDQIKLQWTVTENQLAIPGTVYIQIRALNTDGSVKWSSFKGAMFVEDAINAGTHITGLSELEELERVLNAELEKLDEEGSKAEQQAIAAAASAVAASGSATSASNSAMASAGSATEASGYATNASNSASAAAGSETNASNSATSAANSATAASNSATAASNSATSAANSAAQASAELGNYYLKTETDDLLLNKVDKEIGKGLSTNDYDNAEKAKVSDAQSKANASVRYDEAQSLSEAQKTQARANIGAGSPGGDMSSSVYDPNAHAQDIFAYADAIEQQLDDDKVDKVAGKGLSTNDYDNTEKSNVADNTTARHTHSNKSILDGITSHPNVNIGLYLDSDGYICQL